MGNIFFRRSALIIWITFIFLPDLVGQSEECIAQDRKIVHAQKDFADYLDRFSYSHLFLQGNHTLADSLRSIPVAKKLAEKIVMDTSFSNKARFFAVELLFNKNDSLISNLNKYFVAKVYATALQKNYGGIPNNWGMPDCDYGYIGTHVISLGPDAIKAFHPLLKDRRGLKYSGSRQATQSELYNYRINDIAAMYIVAIHKRDKDYKPCRWLFLRRFQIARIKLIRS